MKRSLFVCGVMALTALIGVGSAQEAPPKLESGVTWAATLATPGPRRC